MSKGARRQECDGATLLMKYLRRRCRFFLRPRLAKLAAECWLRVNHQVDGPTNRLNGFNSLTSIGTLGWEGGEARADFCPLGDVAFIYKIPIGLKRLRCILTFAITRPNLVIRPLRCNPFSAAHNVP